MHDEEMTSRTPQFPPSSEMNFEEAALGRDVNGYPWVRIV